MPDSVLGLPLHPLVVHAVVVLVPLAAVGALVLAVAPSWRRPYGPLVLAVATLGTAAVPVATNTGWTLSRSLELGGAVADQVARHSGQGQRVLWAALPMWLLLVALVLVHRAGRRDGLENVVAVLAAVAGMASIVLVLLTGHSGATAVWGTFG